MRDGEDRAVSEVCSMGFGTLGQANYLKKENLW